jgi:hypothetical protein
LLNGTRPVAFQLALITLSKSPSSCAKLYKVIKRSFLTGAALSSAESALIKS